MQPTARVGTSFFSGRPLPAYQRMEPAKPVTSGFPPHKSIYFGQISYPKPIFGKMNRFGFFRDPGSPIQKFWNRNTWYGYNYIPGFSDLPGHKFYGANGAGYKKWLGGVHPAVLMKMPVAHAANILREIVGPDIPDFNPSPPYDAKWGRRANYILTIPRALGTPWNFGHDMREGIYGAIKTLPLIPASQDGVANCPILVGLFPTANHYEGRITGDHEENSLYAADLRKIHDFKWGLSRDLFPEDFKGLSEEDYIKAYNDLAHYRGLKTGFYIPLSEGQLRINGHGFSWHHNTEDFINACCYAISLGFDAIYFDSAKHVGGYDGENYWGVGAMPDYGKMQYITHQIRKRSGRDDLSFVGEQCDSNIDHFRGMGLTAGVGSVAADRGDIGHHIYQHNWSKDYAPGPAIGNDNDRNNTPWEQKLERIDACLFQPSGAEKLPTLLTMFDLWPCRPYTSFHDLMKHNKSFGGGDAEAHWNNLFAGPEADWYIRQVNKKFAHAAGYHQ